MPITKAQPTQYLADLDTAKSDLDGASAQVAATRAAIAALVPDDRPPNWWDNLPMGVLPAPQNYVAQPAPYNIYGPDGQSLPIKPRQNSGQIFERHAEPQADLLRVTDTPPVAGLPNWWIKAEELSV